MDWSVNLGFETESRVFFFDLFSRSMEGKYSNSEELNQGEERGGGLGQEGGIKL